MILLSGFGIRAWAYHGWAQQRLFYTQREYRVLYIPSGFTWQSFIFPDGQTLRQPASPLIDENLSPMGLRVKHDMFSMTRTDKIKFISTFCSENRSQNPNLSYAIITQNPIRPTLTAIDV